MSLLLLLLGLPAGLRAQDSLYTITGRVLDEKSEALLGASVSLLQSDGKPKTGAITAKDGAFLLKGIAAGSYTLRISYVGYKTHTAPIRLAKQSLTLPAITLQAEGEVLEGVKVVGKTSDVVIKGDTIEFHAGNFTTNQGAVVADLIKKLPGASIDENGNITINGKTVKQIMVDGKRFFEGDPKVAATTSPPKSSRRYRSSTAIVKQPASQASPTAMKRPSSTSPSRQGRRRDSSVRPTLVLVRASATKRT